jgi:hypothetical protein
MALPRTISYPVGAEVVSAALEGVPQYQELKIGFYDKPTIFESDYHRLLKGGVYPVMAVAYRHLGPGISGSNRDIETGFYSESWELSVYP